MTTPLLQAGPYRLDGVLARTGLGVLHQADGAVVKLVHPYLTPDSAVIDRLFGRLDDLRALPASPNVLAPIAWGRDGETVWIAAPPAAGSSLERLDLPIDAATTARIVDGVVAGLETAGIHGNLKPSNVFSTDDQVQIGDAGLWIIGNNAPDQFRGGLRTPHPAFTAPECLDGQDPTEHSDLFALAVLAYWLRTGEFPFAAGSASAMRAGILAGTRPRRDDRLPAEAMALFDRALSPDPWLRPASARAFADELRAVDHDVTIAPAAPLHLPAMAAEEQYFSDTLRSEQWYSGKRYRKGWRWWGTVLGATAAIIAIGLGAWAYSERPPDVPPPSTNVSSRSVAGAWELARFDPRNTGNLPAATSGIRGEVRWKITTDAPFRGSPATDGTTVYAGFGDNRIVAFDAATGSIRWQIPTSGPVDYTPVIAGDLVYVGLRDWRLLAIERATGTIRWERPLFNPVSTPGVVVDGILYQPTTERRLFALDAATGDTLWEFDAGATISGSPAILDDLVIVHSENGWLHVLNRANGVKQFDYLVAGSARGSPIALPDTAFSSVGSSGRRTARLVAIDVRQRWEPFERERSYLHGLLWLWGVMDAPSAPKGARWTLALPGTAATSPALKDGILYVGSGKAIVAADAANGKQIWQTPISGVASAGVVATADTLYAGAEDGTVTALDPTSGQIRWTYATGGEIRPHLAVTPDTLYVASNDGTLTALR